VLLGVSEFSPALEEKLIRQLLERRVDGLILTGGNRRRAVHDMIKTSGVPLVVTWKLFLEDAELPTVSFDNYRGGFLAMEHLITLGHRKIALICGRTELIDRARERRRAYEDSIIACGLKVDEMLIHEADFQLDCGRDAMRESFAAARTANGCVLRERRSSHRRAPRMRGTWGTIARGIYPL
jgi:LacI family transcriptional regulator